MEQKERNHEKIKTQSICDYIKANVNANLIHRISIWDDTIDGALRSEDQKYEVSFELRTINVKGEEPIIDEKGNETQIFQYYFQVCTSSKWLKSFEIDEFVKFMEVVKQITNGVTTEFCGKPFKVITATAEVLQEKVEHENNRKIDRILKDCIADNTSKLKGIRLNGVKQVECANLPSIKVGEHTVNYANREYKITCSGLTAAYVERIK